MGFRNPFRIQVDENDVAYVTDYSPDSQTAAAVPRAAGHRPLRDRPQAGELRLADCATTPNLPYYRWNFNDHHAGSTPTPQPYDCGNPARRPEQRLAGTLNGGPSVEPGLRRRRRSPSRTSGTRTATTTRDAARHAVLRLLRPTRPIAPGLDDAARGCSRSSYTGGVGPHGARQVPLRPGQPEPDEVPAVLRQLGLPRRVHAGHAARGQARLAEPRLQDQQVPGLRRRRSTTPAFPFECDNPMDMQFGRGRRLLPADLRRRLLQHQPRRRHVQVGVRQGPAGAEGRADRRRRPTARAADGQVLQRGLERRRPGRLDHASSGTSATAPPTRSTRTRRTPTPTAAATRRMLTVTDSSGKTDSASTTITAGNTARR